MKGKIFVWICLLILAVAPRAKGTHIAGAELTYDCLGNQQYRVRLTLYRDCANGQAGFDNPITLFVFDAQGFVYNTYNVNVPFNTPEIIPENWNACVGTPYNICVEEGIYETVVTLPAAFGGYDFAWARCCRNNIITNLQDPQCEGVTFLAHVPGPDEAICNSMPKFNNSPSLFLCAGEPFFFDYSATDPDGDSLAYEISNPYTGLDFNNAGAGNNSGNCGFGQPQPAVSTANPMGPPPYLNVTFSAGHSFLNPFGPGGFISINPTTGYLTAIPQNQGAYVVAVSVKEYRNGILLSENKRDFQFYVFNCLPQGTPPVLTHDLSGISSSNDTIFAQAGQPFCYDFTVEDSLAPSGIVVTPLSVSFGGNGGFPPPYATLSVNGTAPPVSGQICWQPACDYVGQTIEMIISARDTNDCPNYNIVFDTIWVVVTTPPAAPPIVDHDFAQVAVSNADTIIISPQGTFCYNFIVVDTLGVGNLTYENILMDTSGNVLNQVQGLSSYISGDTLYGEVCWQGFCNYGATYMFVTRGTDEFQCPPDNFGLDTVWLRVEYPYNPAPTLNTGLPSPSVNDTILATVHDEFCFEFQVNDTSILAGDSLLFGYRFEDLNGNLAPGAAPTYFATYNNDEIDGQICWVPRCVNVGNLYRIIVRGTQQNECQIQNSVFDTLYVRVTEPVKPPPLISHDLGPLYPDNYTIDLRDDESFCFDFMLEDTAGPTYLQISTEIFLANGQPFFGDQPDITFNTLSDSLVEGDVCWTVPCDLANQSFKIRFIGRDTFDCNSSNQALDSVFVVHTEEAPATPELCVATVERGDSAIGVYWLANSESDGVAYVVFRGDNGPGSLLAFDTVWNYADTAWFDLGADVDGRSYCYALQALDRCGRLSAVGDASCTILLGGERDDYQSVLEWSEYRGFIPSVVDYEVWRNYPVLGNDELLLISVNSFTLNYTDHAAAQPRICYRIRGEAPVSNCGPETWSNEVCIDFPATLFVPSAFTPNGDNLNDFFTSFGEFEESFYMEIYDRWGKLLFLTRDKATGWNGTIDGKAAPEGVYVYKIEVRGFDGQVLNAHGTITLIR